MPGPVFIAGDEIDLRTVEEEDLDFFRETINDPAVRRYLSMRTPINGRQEREWWEERASDDDGQVAFCIAEDAETPVGSVSLHHHGVSTTEIGISLARESWGNGYGTAASRLVTTYAFDELRKHRVEARVFDGNVGSRRIWEKLGFDHEAVHREAEYLHGEHVDVHRYAMLADEWDPRDG